jgi:sec-independent protein translocase protein TatC
LDLIDEKMPLTQHLSQLRKRIIICFIAIVTGMIASYILYDIIVLDIIKGPIDALSGREDNFFVLINPFSSLINTFRQNLGNPVFNLHYIGPTEGFVSKFLVSFFSGIIIAFPFVIIQVWLFISPGLKKKEKKLILLYFPLMVMLFIIGITFAYFVLIPLGLYFLLNISNNLVPMITISKYISLVISLLILFGLLFELPLVILFLTRLGVITPEFLSRKRRYAIFFIFIIAALLTPPDIFTQFIMAVPLILLYEVSILVSKVARKRPLIKKEIK